MTRPQALSSGRNSWGPLPMTPQCIGFTSDSRQTGQTAQAVLYVLAVALVLDMGQCPRVSWCANALGCSVVGQADADGAQ